MLYVLSFLCIGLGCLLGMIGGLGMLKLPDTYARLHAGGVTDTLCSFLILFGLGLQATEYIIYSKLVLIFMFFVFTSPASSYALANNAWNWGLRHDQKVHILSLDALDDSLDLSDSKGGNES